MIGASYELVYGTPGNVGGGSRRHGSRNAVTATWRQGTPAGYTRQVPAGSIRMITFEYVRVGPRFV